LLEGLNAVLDHRAEAFIPELGRAFACAPGFRVFAAQNPLQEGGGRRGLPRSFLNRFTRVHVELLQPADLALIAGALRPLRCPRSRPSQFHRPAVTCARQAWLRSARADLHSR
jgi:midasin (ATPase involved in ribosome maturation)